MQVSMTTVSGRQLKTICAACVTSPRWCSISYDSPRRVIAAGYLGSANYLVFLFRDANEFSSFDLPPEIRADF